VDGGSLGFPFFLVFSRILLGEGDSDFGESCVFLWRSGEQP
jgi:hypothetical protein